MAVNNRLAGASWMIMCPYLLALVLFACGGGDDRAYSRRSTVIVAYSNGDKALNPDYGDTNQFLVFLPLVAYDEKGELEGRLARRWEDPPDYRERTYHLRTDVRWHDGVPVTAHDIKFSMELMMHPDVLEEAPGFFGSVTVVDDSTLTLRDARGLGAGNVFWPKHLLEHLDPKEFYEWGFWTQPVGNGPYRFVRYVPHTLMEFEANRDYYRGTPRIERVVLKFAGEAGFTELLSGNVDAIASTNSAQIPKLAADPRFRVYHWMLERVARAIYWQTEHPFFRDPGVRRALTLAINRRELLQVLNLPETIPIVDGPYTFRQLRRGQLPEPLPYDPARARTLLDASGWRDRNGDGVRERDGKEARFTAIVGGGWAGFDDMAVYVQDQLRRVGVRMEVKLAQNPTVLERMRTGEFEAAFAMSAIGWPASLQRHFGEDSPLGYKNAQVVRLIDRAMVTADPDMQDRIYKELMEIFRAELPVTFMFPRVETVFAHRRIQGLSSPWRADPLLYMEDLWLEDDGPQR